MIAVPGVQASQAQHFMLAAFYNRIKSYGAAGTIPYALGRFRTVRRAYSRGVSSLQQFGGAPGLRTASVGTLFPQNAPEDIAARLRTEAAAFDLRLPKDVVSALQQHAAAAPIKDWGSQQVWRQDDVVDGRLPNGAPVFVADVVGTDVHPAAVRVARDPVLVDAVSDYLGYRVLGVDTRMMRSFVVDAPVEQRRRTQTVDFHFDVHGYNFVYANFYVTDVDAESGAHEMVMRSHADKPLHWLFGSARRTDEEIIAHYGKHRLKLITGPAGEGFVQDSSCYHRVLAPVTRERLMLHLRYY